MAGATYLTSSPPPSSSSFLSKAAPLLPALLHHTSPLGGLSYAPQSQQHQLRLSIPCLLKITMAAVAAVTLSIPNLFVTNRIKKTLIAVANYLVSQSYGPPQGQYGPPQGQYGPPQGQYGPPQGQYYGPPQGQPPMQYQQAPPQQSGGKRGGGGCLTACLAAMCCCCVAEEGCECW